jgi:hypothetical protein
MMNKLFLQEHRTGNDVELSTDQSPVSKARDVLQRGFIKLINHDFRLITFVTFISL